MENGWTPRLSGVVTCKTIDARTGEVVAETRTHNLLMDTFSFMALTALLSQEQAPTGTARVAAWPERILVLGVSTGTTAPTAGDRTLDANVVSPTGAYYQGGLASGRETIGGTGNIASVTGFKVTFDIQAHVANPSTGDKTYREIGLFTNTAGAIPVVDRAPGVTSYPQAVLIARSLFASPYPVKNSSRSLNIDWQFNIA